MKNANKIARTLIVAGIYLGLTLLFPEMSYGPVQFRISEIMTLLCYYNPFYIPAILIGVFASNIFSSLGPIDLLFGTCHSLVSVYLMTRTEKLWKASLIPALFSFIIAGQIVIVSSQAMSFIGASLSIMLSEFIIVTLIGVPSFNVLEQNKIFNSHILSYNKNKKRAY